MANLIEYIQSQIYENSTEDISGSIMQQVLTRMASDEGVVNVHTISGQTPFADYNNAQAARDAVPADFKKLGLIITYKLSSGWYVDEFIGSATSGWSTASNWKCLGPISVSQNASTGKTTITIGSESFDVATQPVSVSQNTEKTTIQVGGDTPKEIANYDNTPLIKQSHIDLSIEDENGNSIMYLEDGYLRTKNFNSKRAVITANNNDDDCDIRDENDNVLLRLKDGHIRTKKFNSKFIKIEPLKGRTFSILGDSISTFQGYLRSDEQGYDGAAYAYWYPKTYLNNVNQTWWKKLESLTGMTLLQNCAWSGSQVCGNSQSTTSAQAGCSTRRIADLAKNGVAPDIIIILIGVNDLRNSDSRALGDWNGNDEIVAESTNVATFSDAYSLMVSKIMTTYPNSEVFCCTILDTGHSGWDTHDNAKYPCMNDRGNTTKEWNDTIRMVSESLGANVLDMHACGIDFFNLDTYTGDRLHPNANGATLMAQKAARELISKSKLTIN